MPHPSRAARPSRLDVGSRLSSDPHQSFCSKNFIELTTILGIVLRRSAKLSESYSKRFRERCVWQCGVQNEVVVQILDQQPPTGPQRLNKAPYNRLAFGNMLQHRACVDEIEGTIRQRITDDVVSLNPQVRLSELSEKLDIQVRRKYCPGRANLPTQPVSD